MENSRPAARDHAGIFVPAPLVYALFFLAGLALDRLVPLPRMPLAIGRPAGALLALGAVALDLWSGARMRAARTTPIPLRPTTAIVTRGPYRFTRNPMYLGMLLFYVGLALFLGRLWPLALAPAVVWVLSATVIAREERYLEGKFGDEYRQYRARVRRWV
jgi:protein-S-isoprenylcysteine O-methyltransferase Ste14